jgi:hypothetical protein
LYASALCAPLNTENAGSVIHLFVMESEKKWMELCELAATEKDSAKLLTLVQEINRLLAERDKSAKANLQPVPPADTEPA